MKRSGMQNQKGKDIQTIITSIGKADYLKLQNYSELQEWISLFVDALKSTFNVS
jgi:hypothetical protein